MATRPNFVQQQLLASIQARTRAATQPSELSSPSQQRSAEESEQDLGALLAALEVEERLVAKHEHECRRLRLAISRHSSSVYMQGVEGCDASVTHSDVGMEGKPPAAGASDVSISRAGPREPAEDAEVDTGITAAAADILDRIERASPEPRPPPPAMTVPLQQGLFYTALDTLAADSHAATTYSVPSLDGGAWVGPARGAAASRRSV